MRTSAAFAAVIWVGLSGAVAASPLCDTAATTTPAPSFTPERQAKHAASLAGLSAPVDVVLFGDSLMAGWPPNMLHSTFPGERVANLAVGGDRVQNVLWTIERPEVAAVAPQSVIVLAGTNNLWAGDPGCAIAAGLAAIGRRATTLWPKATIYLVEIPPRGENFAFRDDERRAANASVAAVAKQAPGVKAVNLDASIVCRNTRPCPNYLSDNLHFARGGYAVLAEAIRAAMATP